MRKWTTINVSWETHNKARKMAEASGQTIAEIVKQAVNAMWDKATSPEGFDFNVKVTVADEIW